MAANKKPRKKYKPRFPQGKVVLPSLVRYSANDDFKLKFIPHHELERFRDGTANESSWHTVTVRLDWGLFMATDHFLDEEAKHIIMDGLEAMLSIKERNAKLNKWGATGQEFYAAGLALNVIDEMQDKTTRREQHDSLEAMLRMNDKLVKEGKTGLVRV